MENIPGYDEWRTTPPDEPDPAGYCDICGTPVYEGDYLTDICGEKWCDDCLNDRLRKTI